MAPTSPARPTVSRPRSKPWRRFSKARSPIRSRSTSRSSAGSAAACSATATTPSPVLTPSRRSRPRWRRDRTAAATPSPLANLPTVDPIPGNHAYYMTSAQAKALGLQGPSDALDGTVQFANNPPFDYDRSDGITPGSYDFYGSVAHEFSEVMGRELNAIGNEVQTGKPNGYYPFDLFKYSAAGRAVVRRNHARVISRRTAASPTWTTSTPIRTTTSAIGPRAPATTLFAPSATPAS